MGNGLKIEMTKRDEDEFVIVNYDEEFDYDNNERTCISGRFEKKKYFEGLKKLINEGKCEIRGVNYESLSFEKDKNYKDNICVGFSNGGSTLSISVNLENLLLGELKPKDF